MMALRSSIEDSRRFAPVSNIRPARGGNMAKSAALQEIIDAIRSRPIPMDVSWAERRQAMEAWQAGLKIPAEVKTQPVDASGVRAEWIWRPESDRGRAILYLHGGGYAIGSIATHRYLMQRIAQTSGARVLGIDYRLAPENPFPAAVDDAVTAWRWMLGQGLQPARCAIGGDSAGGGLTLATLVALRDRGLALPGVGVLLSPWTDLAATGASIKTKAAEDPMVTDAGLRSMADAYLAGTDPRHPLASPLYADLAGLPPLLIQVGSAEILLDDATRVAEKAKAAGAEVALEAWPDMLHVFQAFPTLAESGQAIQRIGDFVRSKTAASAAAAGA
jgi:acetyl esterase/lipase